MDPHPLFRVVADDETREVTIKVPAYLAERIETSRVFAGSKMSLGERVLHLVRAGLLSKEAAADADKVRAR